MRFNFLNKNKLDIKYIESELSSKTIGKKIIFEDEIDSTNLEVKRRAETLEDGTVFIADFQTSGYGRFNRKWSSPKGKSILMSILLKSGLERDKNSLITLITALSLSKSIDNLIGYKTKIKWPNDILINNKKVCGILTQTSILDKKNNYIIIGVGINVNIKRFPKEISKKVTSLYLESKTQIDRSKLIVGVLSDLNDAYLKKFDFNFIDEFKQKCISLGKEVIVNKDQKSIKCLAIDINKQGELIVKTDDSKTFKINSGEVLVQDIY